MFCSQDDGQCRNDWDVQNTQEDIRYNQAPVAGSSAMNDDMTPALQSVASYRPEIYQHRYIAAEYVYTVLHYLARI